MNHVIKTWLIPPTTVACGAGMDRNLNPPHFSHPRILFLRNAKKILVAIVSLGVCSASIGQADDAAKVEFFETRIRPVLVEHCYECHSAQSKGLKAGLFVDSADGLRVGGDSGPAIEPGDSQSSLLMQALRYESTEMPPQGKLPDSVIADFAKWIDSGAIDPRSGGAPVEKQSIQVDAFRDFWSYVPPRKPALPEVSRPSWPARPIDHFVLAEMDRHGLAPVAPADKRALIRRATFDLTGLPPTPDEVESFVEDNSPEAFERVVDRLLRSPAYGERWGRYWLDVARYAEDQAHTFAVKPNTSGFRYRDWVISAFNSDMPYDLFVKRQIAADLLPTDDEQPSPHLAALGYFGLGAQYYKNTDAAKAAADELDDRIDTLTRGFLGLTVSCARCHDHKFDPIPQADYYSLAGIFQSSRLHNAPLVPQNEVDAYQESQKEIKSFETEINDMITAEGSQLRESARDQIADYMMATWKLSQAQKTKSGLNHQKLAEQSGLNAKTLKRWSDFLGGNEGRKWNSLTAWYAATKQGSQPDDSHQGDTGPDDSEPAMPPAAVAQAAQAFQRFTSLMLLQRDGKLSADQQQELARSVDPGSVYRSPLVTKKHPQVSIDVDISGAKQLFLVVTDGGNGNGCDHADWAQPVLVMQSGQTMNLVDMKWRETKTSYGNVNINRNVGGQPIRIAGMKFDVGLGTHATSMIAYDLPEGVSRFVAIAGLDNSGTDQGGDCGASASVQFHVYTETPRDIEVDQPDLLDKIFGAKGLFEVEPAEIEKQLSPQKAEQLAQQRAKLQKMKEAAPAMYPIAHTIAEAKPADMKVFIRGNPANQGEVAPRRFLQILSGDEPKPYTQGSGRLELAESIASADNPLTARVMVNRIWQHHFGQAIVATADNFGSLGDKPTHPELLDYLTVLFLESGWSVKTMHREIMLSSTYQLSSQPDETNLGIDADNRYLWRMNRRRLEVEAWRDAMLAVSGKLDLQMQGPSVNLADDNNSRRTVYAMISRHELNNMLRLFDFPDANITASSRSETTVPQQQLFVLNSPFVIQQAKAFARRIEQEAGPDTQAQVRHAFAVAYGRPVTDAELALAVRYLEPPAQSPQANGNSLSRLERYAQVLLGSNEFMYLD
jgi:hypothetical protein